MDCNHARLLLIFARKRSELEATEAEALDGHLKNCTPCASLAEAERKTDEAVSHAMRDVPIPAGLQGRLLAGLERDRKIIRWRQGLTAAGLAAGVLLAVGLAWFLWLGAKTTPDYVGLEDDITAKFAATPETVEQWFQDKGMRMEAPRQFNFGLLTSFDIAQFMNRRVPKLVFFYRDRDNSALAEVYVLSGRQFNLEQVPQHPASMVLLTDNPDFHYVAIFYPRGSKDLFLHKGGLQN